MRLFLFLAACLGINPLCCQITDNFSDGNFNSNPSWTGDSAKFSVLSEVLTLNAPAKNDTAVLSLLSNSVVNAHWSISVSLYFNPSSSNYCKIYLMADATDLKKSLHGYFVKLGGSQDEISLYRQDGLTETKIIDGKDGRLNSTSSKMRISVLRDLNYNFTLLIDTLGDTNFISEGSVIDSNFIHSTSFGISCKYTSTRSDKFSFDDLYISGSVYTDKVRPTLVEHGMINDTTWRLIFSESIDTMRAKKAGIRLDLKGYQNSDILFSDEAHEMKLIFNRKFPHGKLVELSVDSIFDLVGNALTNKTLGDVYNFPDSIFFKDVIFSEIMPDPEPVVALPASEYIELYNRSADIINLEQWIIHDEKDSLSLPFFLFYPGKHLLIADNTDSAFWKDFNVLKIFADLPSLNNDADGFGLISSNGKTIDSLFYNSKQHQKDKSSGGWALELIDPSFLCSDTSNWKSSVDLSGGSPGKVNSVNAQDNSIRLLFKDIINLDESTIRLRYTGFPYPGTFMNGHFSSSPETSLNQLISHDEHELELIFNDSLKRNETYVFSLSDLSDCYGRTDNNLTFSAIIPDEATPADVIINEILFNPYAGGSDFVEIYNRSSHFFDLSHFWISNGISDTTRLSTGYFIVHPHDYIAFSKDTGQVISTYQSSVRENIRFSSLPPFSDKQGSVMLLGNGSEPIDEMTYDESMHFPLLESNEGVSLERIYPGSAGLDVANWASASENAGFATPGAKNSQFLETTSSHFNLEPKVISPDNDGYDDVLSINYQFSSAGNLGSVYLYNSQGQLIRRLISQKLLSTQGSLFWDGLDENRQKVDIGYYLVLFEYINQRGEAVKELATVVVANKF